MGWSTYWIDEQKRPKKINRKTPKKDNVTFMPIVLEEKPEIVNE